MPRRKKHPIEETTEETMKKLFHPKVIEHVKSQIADADHERKPASKSSSQEDSN